jgi:hypothetical protein
MQLVKTSAVWRAIGLHELKLSVFSVKTLELCFVFVEDAQQDTAEERHNGCENIFQETRKLLST